MPDHLSQEQLIRYRERRLAEGELIAVDSHLSDCASCRSMLSGLREGAPAAAIISEIEQARFHHLSYEQMDDWVEDRLEASAREVVMAHIGGCAACARQLIAYQEYAPVMSAAARVAKVGAKASFWSYLKQPHYALAAAAVVAFFVITPFTRHSIPEETGAIIAPANTAAESKIPAQGGSLIEEENVERPASLKGLEGNGDGVLEYPFSEVVAETRPVLRWKAFGDSYSVSLSDSRGLISRQNNLRATQWTSPSALVRDRIYTWEVESGGQKHRGMFRVLGENQLRELEKARAEHGDSHLMIGSVSEQLGLLTQARLEFEAMAKNSAEAQQAATLLNQLEALRK